MGWIATFYYFYKPFLCVLQDKATREVWSQLQSITATIPNLSD